MTGTEITDEAFKIFLKGRNDKELTKRKIIDQAVQVVLGRCLERCSECPGLGLMVSHSYVAGEGRGVTAVSERGGVFEETKDYFRVAI